MTTSTVPTPFLDSLGDAKDATALRDGLMKRNPDLANATPSPLTVVGAAPEGARLLDLCAAHGQTVLAVCDGDPAKHGTDFHGHVVKPISDALTSGPLTKVIVASHKPLAAVKSLRAMGARAVAPFALLQVLYPESYPPHMFYAGWLEDLSANRARYAELRERLSHDRGSVRALEAIIGFRLTLDVTLLEPVLGGEAFLSRDLVTFDPDGTYVDGGAFDGDTIHKYLDAASGRVGRAIAFEPDPSTFDRLKRNFAGDRRIEPIKAGLYDRTDVLRFVNDGSRAALISGTGDIEVPVVSLDEVLSGSRVDYIKLNIEGAELAALEGARQSIARYHPTLAISAYHAPDHLWRVPELILSIDLGYTLYLRQHDGGAVETVVYAIPQS